MAQPPGDVTRPYSPSKLNTDTPLFLATPSSGPLNNSGTYNAATTGPIVASGHGQPHLREDGQAFWDDSKPTPHPIIVDSSSPLEAGRSPQDSRMNSPESEEPTIPTFDTTQVGPATMQALEMVLDNVPEHAASSQDLWDNVPSLPADLPPQPEVIEVRGRPQATLRTPRGRSQANSNTSVWSHATIESISIRDVNELPSNECTRECDSFVTSTRAREYSFPRVHASTSFHFRLREYSWYSRGHVTLFRGWQRLQEIFVL
ncbi:hypothetical protein EDB89DRAFT_2068521 [Lactarius sanguifluus]|nr:hypothetical protein EDB89DRAFT_2068521 [Lactarius sanguifluus]